VRDQHAGRFSPGTSVGPGGDLVKCADALQYGDGCRPVA